MSSWWVQLGGALPATLVAPHSPPTFETEADGGCLQASFAFAVTKRTQHQLLNKGTLVRVMDACQPMWTGTLYEFDRNTGEAHAKGLSSGLYDYLALDAGGNATRNVQVAIDQAIANTDTPWQGRNPYAVGAAVTVPGDSTGGPISVGALLDELVEWFPGGLRWGTDADGNLYTRAPGVTEPRWMAMPDATAFGTTTENTPQRLAGKFFDGTNYPTAYAGSGLPQAAEDLTNYGTLTMAQAEQILAGKLKRSSFTGWVNGVDLSRDQFRTLGGTARTNLGMVTAGQTMRAHGLPYSVTQDPFLDVEIGRTKYTAGDDSIYLEPINTAPRNAEAVWAA